MDRRNEPTYGSQRSVLISTLHSHGYTTTPERNSYERRRDRQREHATVPHYTQGRAGLRGIGAPKGGPGSGVSAGPRVPCTCGLTHAMPCRKGGKAVQGGAPTYAQQASGGTQPYVKSEFKSEYKTEHKPKQVALRALTANEVLAQLDDETRKRVTQQLDQKANGGSDPKEKKPKGQKKGYDPTVYQPKGPQ